MAVRAEIIDYCDRLLDAGGFADYAPNGLQVPGAEQVSRLATGVSANLEFIEAAVEAGSQLAIVHHGLFWEGAPLALSARAARRLRALLEADLSLVAYHLPLDAHRELGNNAMLCAALGFEQDPTDFAVVRGRPIGIVGRRGEPVETGELAAGVARLLGREPLVFDSGPRRIETIAIVSGSGSGELEDAIDRGLDAFLTGEPREPVMAAAREGGINYIAAGHHATETFGVRRLGELIEQRFGIEHRFIDVPNPI
jgi:dinuclear metal center YbgI/SA1388 family protein